MRFKYYYTGNIIIWHTKKVNYKGVPILMVDKKSTTDNIINITSIGSDIVNVFKWIENYTSTINKEICDIMAIFPHTFKDMVMSPENVAWVKHLTDNVGVDIKFAHPGFLPKKYNESVLIIPSQKNFFIKIKTDHE